MRAARRLAACRWLPLLAAGLLLGACGRPAPDADEAGDDAPPAAAAAPSVNTALSPPVPAPALIRVAVTGPGATQKLRTYIDCFNDLDERTRGSVTQYFLSFDANGLGAGRPVPVAPSGLDAGALVACRKRFDQVAAQTPRMERLDAAGADYIARLTALASPLNDAATYYRQQDYRDDDFAKGRVLHPQLLAAFQAFIRASRTLADAVELEEQEALPAQLARLEKKEGRKAAYWNLAIALEAQRTVRVIAGERFDPDAAKQQLDAFERVAADAMAYMDAHPRERPPSWNIVAEYTDSLRRAGKARVRRVRDAAPYTEGERGLIESGSARHVAGTPHQVMQAYNGLVGMVNTAI